MKEQLVTGEAPKAIGPYSQGMRVGELLFLSGQLPIDPSTGEMPTTAADQARQSLENVRAILRSAGVDMDAVAKTTVLLDDISDFNAVNEEYEKWFSEPFPSRSCFAVAGLPKGALVEIEVVASTAKK